MQILGQEIDDLKTDRKDILPALPMVFRMVPILFYCSLAFLVFIGALSFWQSRLAAYRLEETQRRTATVKQQIDAEKAARTALETKIRESQDIETWVMSSMPIQPLVLAITRSMNPRSSIVELSLERDVDNPAQLKLAMRINAESDQQLEDTLQAIRKLDYREFSPTQTMERGDLFYRASLIWTQPKPEGTPAAPATAPAGNAAPS